jgi:tetratricopeptide (TPR) repeat protein
MEVCNWSPALALRAAKFNIVPSIRTVVLCLLITLTASGIPSCVATDFVSAYFNTYYNAQNIFSQAELEVMTQIDSRPGGRSWLGTFGVSAGTKTKLDQVIEKCSKLLQYHPESKLIDDALLMIGKAYYYEDENQQAVRKFNEIIDGYPDGSCAVEARLLLSYSQYRMNARDDARTTAQAVVDIAKKNDKPGMISRASLVLGQMAQEEKDYAGAREYFDQAAQYGASAEERSSASLMSAEMYRKMKKYHEAEEAYRRAQKSSNNYTGEYRGTMGALRMIEKEDRFDEALAGLRLLRADAKNKEFNGEIELEMANTYRDMGNLPEAVTRYTLVDTTYPRSETSARSFFALGDLYEHVLYRYDSALVAYTKGRNEFPMADVTQQCVRRSEYLSRYFLFHGEIVKCDSILALLRATRDTARAQALAAREPDTLHAAGPPRPLQAPPISADSANARRETAMNELAGLFFATIGLPDSAEFWYVQIVTDNPSGRHVPRALYTLAQIYSGRDSVTSKPVADSLYREIVRRFPRSEFAPESRRLLGLPVESPVVDEAESAYRRAESRMVRGDSTGAAEDFKKLALRFPGSPLASRALYAAGWIYENRVFNRDSAIASYSRLMTLYPLSQFATRIAPKIAEVTLKQKADAAAADTLKQKKAAADTLVSHRSLPPGVSLAPDSLRTRDLIDLPKTAPPPGDSTQAKKPPTLTPRKLPEKEGIPR